VQDRSGILLFFRGNVSFRCTLAVVSPSLSDLEMTHAYPQPGGHEVANLQFNQLVIVAVGVDRVVKIVQQLGTVSGNKVDARDFTFL